MKATLNRRSGLAFVVVGGGGGGGRGPVQDKVEVTAAYEGLRPVLGFLALQPVVVMSRL